LTSRGRPIITKGKKQETRGLFKKKVDEVGRSLSSFIGSHWDCGFLACFVFCKAVLRVILVLTPPGAGRHQHPAASAYCRRNNQLQAFEAMRLEGTCISVLLRCHRHYLPIPQFRVLVVQQLGLCVVFGLPALPRRLPLSPLCIAPACPLMCPANERFLLSPRPPRASSHPVLP
jgi:hypothetical protein